MQVKVLQEIEEELITAVIHNLKSFKAKAVPGGLQWSKWQEEQINKLKDYDKYIQKTVFEKLKDFHLEIEELLKNAYESGKAVQEAEILQARKNGLIDADKAGIEKVRDFDEIDRERLDSLIEDTISSFSRIRNSILKKSTDVYRKVIINAPVHGDKDLKTYEKAVDIASKAFLANGLNCIEYKDGSRMNVSSYASMVLETAEKRAYFQGEGAKRREWGLSTVIVEKRDTGCPKCVRFSGRVAIDDVWSGGKSSDGEYPLLSSFITEGLYHPNCRDGHRAYFEGVTELTEPLTEEEIRQSEAAYRLLQQQKYYERMECKYKRLSEGCLDEGNREKYRAKANEWRQRNQDWAGKYSYIKKSAQNQPYLLDMGRNDIIKFQNSDVSREGTGKLNKEIEIVNARGKCLGEFDEIDLQNKIFYEDKTAKGLDVVNPRTGLPSQTPEQFADKQIYTKTKNRINNLANSAGTREAKTNIVDNVPDILELQGIKNFVFRLDGDSPKLINAVQGSIKKLQVEFPDYTFDAIFGND